MARDFFSLLQSTAEQSDIAWDFAMECSSCRLCVINMSGLPFYQHSHYIRCLRSCRDTCDTKYPTADIKTSTPGRCGDRPPISLCKCRPVCVVPKRGHPARRQSPAGQSSMPILPQKDGMTRRAVEPGMTNAFRGLTAWNPQIGQRIGPAAVSTSLIPTAICRTSLHMPS